MRQKHIPQRTCIVCGTKGAKREMVRVVRAPTGELLVDETGKQPGRGAYLCTTPSCWRQAVKGNRLSHALRAQVQEEDRSRLAAFGSSLS